jgi:molybdate transport system substrate-binding protein
MALFTQCIRLAALLFHMATYAVATPDLQGSPASPAGAREISIAAASDLKFALDELATVYEAKHSALKVKRSYGSSGNLFAMIRNHAPFDIFMSADIQYAQKLAEAGLGADTNVFCYAVGRLVVWVPASSAIQVQSQGMQALLQPSVRKIAIANPRHAPYGRAAEAAMKSLKVYEPVRSKLVFGENISHAMQFVESGAADIGVLALSLVVSPQMRERGRYWEVPAHAYPAIEQGGLLLKSSRDHEASRAFCDFVLSDAGRIILKRYGFCLPGE